MTSVQFSLVAQLCLTLCNSMDCSTPGLPVHHQFPESTQTHVHWVSDVIQPSHPLSTPSSPTFNLSQHQGLFQWVRSLHQVAKGYELWHSKLWNNLKGVVMEEEWGCCKRAAWLACFYLPLIDSLPTFPRQMPGARGSGGLDQGQGDWNLGSRSFLKTVNSVGAGSPVWLQMDRLWWVLSNNILTRCQDAFMGNLGSPLPFKSLFLSTVFNIALEKKSPSP